MQNVILLRGNKPKALTNAMLYGADTVIFDLSTTVQDEDKDIARILLNEAFTSLDYSSIYTIVRINPIETTMGINDIKCFLKKTPEAFIIPISNKETLQIAHENVRRLESALEKKRGSIQIFASVDTVKGFDCVIDLIKAESGLAGVFIDTDKILEDMECSEEERQQKAFFIKCTMDITCKANGLMFIDAKEVACY